MSRHCLRLATLIALLVSSVGAAATDLDEVATSDRQWTGIAVSADQRIFVNFPRWSPDVPISVGELQPDGTVVAYPDPARQQWQPGAAPDDLFVCVQSVHVDAAGRLWILDPANPWFRGVIPGGPKLMQVDLATDTIVRTYPFDDRVAPPASYLNDVRVDVAAGVAFVTDSGLGALVVVDLETGHARRVLDGHATTRAEDIEVIIDGMPFPNPVHADGIALDAAGGWVYWQALTGRTMYRIPSRALGNPEFDDTDLITRIEVVAKSGVSDGLLWTADGVLVSALEDGAIKRVTPDGTVTTLVQDPRIIWPDSFAQGPDAVYVTTAQIHLGPDPPGPYRILRLR
jgi:sugar lactone lactonase YvrE